MENTYRVQMIYIADGMVRPVVAKEDVIASGCAEAVQWATLIIRSVYVGQVNVMAWSVENLDRPSPVVLSSGEYEKVKRRLR